MGVHVMCMGKLTVLLLYCAVGDADFTDVDVAAIAGLLKLFLVSQSVSILYSQILHHTFD